MKIFKRISDAVADWWDGEYTPRDNNDGSGVIIIGGFQRRHWTATVVRTIWDFYLEHWKWLLGLTIPALVAIFIAIKFSW